MERSQKNIIFKIILISVAGITSTHADCLHPPVFQNTNVTCMSTSLGIIAKYTCLDGYATNSSSNTTWLCKDDGSWQGSDFFCAPRSCGFPPLIPNAIQTFTGSNEYLSIVSYRCWNGYTLNTPYFNVTCGFSGTTVQWQGIQVCARVSSYVGCYPVSPQVTAKQGSLSCSQACSHLGMTYAAVMGANCGCITTLTSNAVPDKNCSLPHDDDDDGYYSSSTNSLWSVFTTFHGCFSNISSDKQFTAYNVITCREYCRGLDNRFALYFAGGKSCRCLNETEPTAISTDPLFCNSSAQSTGSSGTAYVYTLEREPRIGSSCLNLFDQGVAIHGLYYFNGSTSPEICHFYDGTACEDTWLGYQGNCYLWTHYINGSSYSDATQYCADRNSLLVSINDEAEANFIKTAFLRLPWYRVDSYWHIGLYDHFRSFAAQWADGSLFSYSMYAPGQPDEFYNQCIRLNEAANVSVNMWDDHNCSNPHHFICERPKEIYGCVSVVKSDLKSVYEFTHDTEMTLTLCFVSCRTYTVPFSGVSGGTCYCLEVLPENLSKLPFSQCQIGCPGNRYQLCGNPRPKDDITADAIVMFVIEDVGQVYLDSCAALEMQGFTRSSFKIRVNESIQTVECGTDRNISCPQTWVYKNGRCYKYFTEAGLDPGTICGSFLESYTIVIDGIEEQHALFDVKDSEILNDNNQWIIGLFNFQKQGVYRTSNGRALKGMSYPNITVASPCLYYDVITDDVKGAECNTKGFICEKGPEYLGCANVPASSILVIDSYADMSVTQCVETCRGRGSLYALVGNTPFRCYCSDVQPNKTTSQCDIFCYEGLGQICGGVSGQVSAYVVDELPMFATSCEDLYNEGVLIHGIYIINGQPKYCYMKDNSSCSEVNTTLWIGVGHTGGCFQLSYNSVMRADALKTCKTLTSLSLPASIRSEADADFLSSLYYKRKTANTSSPLHIGAVDQFQLGCFTWADGWLFDSARWSTGYPNLNYGQINSSVADVFTMVTNKMEIYNKDHTDVHPVLCREVSDYIGCFVNPTTLTPFIRNYASMGLTLCKQTCLGGNKYVALFDTSNCYCLDDVSELAMSTANDSECDVECPANYLQICANPGRLRAHSLDSTDLAPNCSILHANFVVLQNTYMLRDSSTGEIRNSTCGFADNTICPAGFMGHNGKCYRFFPMDFKDATKSASHCISYGGYLATPRNEDEVSFIRTAVDGLPSLSAIRRWRIGLVDFLQGDYFSSSDGSMMRSLMWNGTQNRTNQCSALLIDDGKWVSVPCDTVMPFVCEIGPVYLGCKRVIGALPTPDKVMTYMTVQQCVALCYGQNARYALLRINSCYCVTDQELVSLNLTSATCDQNCFSISSQSCGSMLSTINIVAMYNIEGYTLEDRATTSCSLYRQYGVTSQAQYYLDVGSQRTLKVQCGSNGDKYKDILQLEPLTSFYMSRTSSSGYIRNGLFFAYDMDIMKWLLWLPTILESSPWVQVTLSDFYLVKAVVITGLFPMNDLSYVKEFQVRHGVTNNLLLYEEKFPGVNSSKTELAVRFLRQPVVAKIIRVNPTQWSILPALALTLLGELYRTFNHNDLVIGCFADPRKTLLSQLTSVVSLEDCRQHCLTYGFGMFALVSKEMTNDNCGCLTVIGEFGELERESCNFTCGASSACGSDVTMSVAVYRTYEKQCPELSAVGNAVNITTYLVNTPGVFTFGMNITYNCTLGHEYSDGTTSKSITCQQNNTWSAVITPCQAIQCPAITITNGVALYTDLNFGSQVTSFCDMDHKNQDSSLLRVSVCTSMKAWVPPISNCISVVNSAFRWRLICQSRSDQQVTNVKFKTLHARSLLDCAARCMMVQTCITYDFRASTISLLDNCRLSYILDSVQRLSVNGSTNDPWTSYIMSPLCP